MKTSKLKDLAKEVITEANGRQTLTKDNFDSRLKSFMDKNTGKGSFDKATTPDMPEATKVWDRLVEVFSDNKNDSISYLNSDPSYRRRAITEIFRAMNF
jgi:hypothetical protein